MIDGAVRDWHTDSAYGWIATGLANQIQIVPFSRDEDHPNDHQGKVSWAPRLVPTPKR